MAVAGVHKGVRTRKSMGGVDPFADFVAGFWKIPLFSSTVEGWVGIRNMASLGGIR